MMTASITSIFFIKKLRGSDRIFQKFFPYKGGVHCVKNVRIRRYSGPYFPAIGLSCSEYRHFPRSDYSQRLTFLSHKNLKQQLNKVLKPFVFH